MGLGLDGLNPGSGGNAVAAILLLQALTNVFDTASALNSSPWTSENFGADPEKARSCREYVLHSVVWSSSMCGLAAYIARSWWPLLGAGLANAYLYWLYERALSRGASAGTRGWARG